MKASKLFLVGTHRYANKAGELAEIIGVEMITPNNETAPRPCFKVRYKDGLEDCTSIFDEPVSNQKNPHYELVTEDDVISGRIPEVVH
jgi:hypothetical protein